MGPDARARVTNLIISTVNPRPGFEVQPCGTDNAGNMVAVIRVEDGTNPPYEYERTGDYQIPIRVQDTTRQASLREIEDLLASLREIEDLLAKRRALQAGMDERIGLYLRDSDFPGLTASQRILIVPHSTLRLRLDGAFERGFIEIVGVAGRTRPHAVSRKGAFSLLKSDHRTIGIWKRWRDGFCDEPIAPRIPWRIRGGLDRRPSGIHEGGGTSVCSARLCRLFCSAALLFCCTRSAPAR